MPVIYKITSPTNKVYIGQSWNIHSRKSKYKNSKCSEQPLLYRSILKHSWDKHIFEIVCNLPNDIEQHILDSYEVIYWKLHVDCGLKMLNIKEPGRGGRHTKETKEKISLSSSKENNPMFGLKGKDHPAFGNKGFWKNCKKEDHPRFGVTGKDNPNFGRTGDKHTMFGIKGVLHPSSKKVIDEKTGIIYHSIREAAKAFGLNPKSLACVFQRNYKTSHGLKLLK